LAVDGVTVCTIRDRATTPVLDRMTFSRPADALRSNLAAMLAGLVFVGCASAGGPAEAPTPEAILSAPVTHVQITDSIESDPAIDRMVTPFREKLNAEITRVIGVAAGTFEKGNPEGSLGNLAVDAMFHAAQDLSGERVHIAVTNNGGLRVPIAEGPITLGKIYELMPFENTITIVTLTGVQVDSLAQQIARSRGEPVAGLSFRMGSDAGPAHDIRVGDAPLAAEKVYRVATLDYLVDGGGRLTALWSPMSRNDLGILFRDAIVQYIEARGTIRPALEQRIAVSPPAGSETP
jgi:2',3'-cyclic-nucleotide 2'-phosphodiesterase (5'-nucleotidase family)